MCGVMFVMKCWNVFSCLVMLLCVIGFSIRCEMLVVFSVLIVLIICVVELVMDFFVGMVVVGFR